MVLQWARAKEEIDLGKTMKGGPLIYEPTACRALVHGVCLVAKLHLSCFCGSGTMHRWLECTQQEDQATPEHPEA